MEAPGELELVVMPVAGCYAPLGSVVDVLLRKKAFEVVLRIVLETLVIPAVVLVGPEVQEVSPERVCLAGLVCSIVQECSAVSARFAVSKEVR